MNGRYDGDDALGKLMKDFRCKNARDMHYPELAEGVKYFKEEGGKDEMCEAVEKFAREYAADIIAEKEKVEAEKEKVEAENERLREKLAKYENL